MSKSIAYAGALAAALLVASTGTAAAQSGDLSADSLNPASLTGSAEEGPDLGEAGELLPASVTGSLPGYATGPLGSATTLACNVGSAAGLAANVVGAPLQVPVGIICMVAKPVAESTDAFMQGDAAGSVDTSVSGVPLIGQSLEGNVDTGSAVETVEGSISQGSLAPQS